MAAIAPPSRRSSWSSWISAGSFSDFGGAGLAGLLLGFAVAWAGLPGAAAAATAAVVPVAGEPNPAASVGVYFGQGCFWHVQTDFLDKERASLGREGAELTAIAGYAGGPPARGPVCYHNNGGGTDYSKLGYAEVVELRLPPGEVADFAKFHFDAIAKTGTPPGGPMRNVVGLPGGVESPLYAAVESMNAGRMQLLAGLPGDPATSPSDPKPLGKPIVYIYDTEQFPFRPAEVYHQFNDGKFDDLKKLMLSQGRIAATGCPEQVVKRFGK